jgi:hypothetical protein
MEPEEDSALIPRKVRGQKSNANSAALNSEMAKAVLVPIGNSNTKPVVTHLYLTFVQN